MSYMWTCNTGRIIFEKEERAWFAASVIELARVCCHLLLVGTVSGLLLIFEPDNLERDLELKQASFSWQSFFYLPLTELFPVSSLANISSLSLERLHATLFPLDIVLLESGTTLSLFCVVGCSPCLCHLLLLFFVWAYHLQIHMSMHLTLFSPLSLSQCHMS